MAGMGQFGDVAELVEILQRCQIAALNVAADHAVKLNGPVIDLMAARAKLCRTQVVHQIAAAHNQHAMVAQRLELRPERKVLGCGAAVVHAQLHHGDSGRRKHRLQHAPAAVVQAPFGHVQPHGRGPAGLRQRLADLLCGLRRTRCRVLLRKKGLRETAKVVNRLGVRHAREPITPREPMGRNAQDQLRLWVLHAELCA